MVIVVSLKVQVQEYTIIEKYSKCLPYWERWPRHLPALKQKQFEAAAPIIFFVHAPRIDTEVVPQRRKVAQLGCPVDAIDAWGSFPKRLGRGTLRGCKIIEKHRKIMIVSAKNRVMKSILDQKGGFFAKLFKFTDTSLVLMPYIWCAQRSIGNWDVEKMYQTWTKRSFY